MTEALGSARTLALVRICAGLLIAFSGDVHNAPRYAALDASLSALPFGLSWLGAFSISVASAEALRWLVCAAALIGALGGYARAAFGIASAALFVLLALPQRVGAVTHCHHLLWVALILAASPCADVWSVDAYFEARPLREGGAYRAPLAFLRVWVAAVYFFPGLHKLLAFCGGVSPGAWLRAHAAWKWMQRGEAPALAFALTPGSSTALALSALGFELGMPLLVAFRRTRPLALVAATSFHLGTAWMLFIRFDSLAVLLVSLLDLRPRARAHDWRHACLGASRATLAVGGVVTLGVLVAGALGATQAYPFACYPTFAEQPPDTMPSARVVVHGRGQRCTLPPPRSNAEWVQAFRIHGAYGDALSETRARAYVAHVLRMHDNICPRDGEATLFLQRLAWDGGVRVRSERAVYTMSTSSLGSAPAGAAKGGSSPPK